MAEVPRVTSFAQLNEHVGKVIDVDFGVIRSDKIISPHLVARTTRVAVVAFGKGYEGGSNFARSQDGGFGREGGEYPPIVDNPNSVILAHESASGSVESVEYGPLDFYGDVISNGYAPHNLHLLEVDRR